MLPILISPQVKRSQQGEFTTSTVLQDTIDLDFKINPKPVYVPFPRDTVFS